MIQASRMYRRSGCDANITVTRRPYPCFSLPSRSLPSIALPTLHLPPSIPRSPPPPSISLLALYVLPSHTPAPWHSIGVNVNQELSSFDDATAKIATSISRELGTRVSRERVLANIFNEVDRLMRMTPEDVMEECVYHL